MCVRVAYIACMKTETKVERWTIRVSPSDDMIVRRVVAESGMSLSEYVVRHTVSAATADLADRRVFALSAESWSELQHLLDQPVSPKPRLRTLLAQPSILESE